MSGDASHRVRKDDNHAESREIPVVLSEKSLAVPGYNDGCGASVPMVCISGGGDSQHPHSPGCRPYLARAKRLGAPLGLVVISEKSRFFRSARKLNRTF